MGKKIIITESQLRKIKDFMLDEQRESKQLGRSELKKLMDYIIEKKRSTDERFTTKTIQKYDSMINGEIKNGLRNFTPEEIVNAFSKEFNYDFDFIKRKLLTNPPNVKPGNSDAKPKRVYTRRKNIDPLAKRTYTKRKPKKEVDFNKERFNVEPKPEDDVQNVEEPTTYVDRFSKYTKIGSGNVPKAQPAELLWMDKSEYNQYFNKLVGFDLYDYVRRYSKEKRLFFGVTKEGAPIFLNDKAYPYFDKEYFNLLNSSGMVAAYINTMRFTKTKKKTTYIPQIRDVVHVESENCLYKVIDVHDNVLWVDMGTNLTVYNATTHQGVKDRVPSTNCVDFPDFKPDQNLIDLSIKLQDIPQKVVKRGRPSKEEQEEISKKYEINGDMFQFILSKLKNGDTLNQIIRNNGFINIQDVDKYMDFWKKETLYNMDEKNRTEKVNESTRKTIVITESQLLMIRDYYKKSNVLNEGVEKNDAVDLLTDINFLINHSLSRVFSFAKNEKGLDELKTMMSHLNTIPFINTGVLSYYDTKAQISHLANRLNTTIAIVNQAKNIIEYIKPRIKYFVENKDELNRKEAWLNRLNELEEDCEDLMFRYNKEI